MITIALDPNIILGESMDNVDCGRLIDDIQKKQKMIRIGVDDDGVIAKKYEDLWRNKTTAPLTKEWLRQLITGEYLHELSAPIIDSHIEWLESSGCDTPVEPHLIGICADPDRDVRLAVVGHDLIEAATPKRGLHDENTRQKVADEFNITIWKDAQIARRGLSDWLTNSPPYPYTYYELCEFIRQNRKEGQTLEFKQPKPLDGSVNLTPSILEDSMKEICAMLNAGRNNCKLIIGIDEDDKKHGVIRGFHPKYAKEGSPKPKNHEELSKLLWNENYLSKFDPPLTGNEVTFEFIELPSSVAQDSIVIVFHINPRDERIYYGTKSWLRIGPEKRKGPRKPTSGTKSMDS